MVWRIRRMGDLPRADGNQERGCRSEGDQGNRHPADAGATHSGQASDVASPRHGERDEAQC